MFNSVPDDVLLEVFLSLKGQLIKRKSQEARSLIDTGISLDKLREISITENRKSLLSKIISLDWKGVMSEGDVDHIQHTKRFVKDYMARVTSRESFVLVYTALQEVIVPCEDVLYYLNPLKFKGYEVDAINNMRVNSILDYSGFVSACRVHKIDETIIQDFIARMK